MLKFCTFFIKDFTLIKNIIKLVFLGVAGFALLVFLTAEKPTEMNASQGLSAQSLTLSTLPSTFELVGKEEVVNKADLFKTEQETLVIVGNHDSLAVVKDLPKLFDISLPYVMVANISSAPWFVKKMFIPGKLEELNENSNIPMIYDFEGNMVNALGVTNNAKTAFSAYKVNIDGTIVKLLEGEVKEGALDGAMSDEEKKQALQPLVEML